MAFTSFLFLGFLAITLPTYWIVRHRVAQNVILLLASYVFYGWLTPWYCVLLFASTLVTYGSLLMLWKDQGEKKSMTPVVISVVFNLVLLCTLKYWNFFLTDIEELVNALGWSATAATLKILLPLGISFYCLQAIGLTVDAYRKDIDRQSFLNVALFLAFFSKVIAGPFEPAKTLIPQFNEVRVPTMNSFGFGIQLLLIGFAKKLVIAENIGLYVNQVYALSNASMPILLAGTLGFAIQLLADFSGYTDMARGTAALFGFNLMENFNSPYRAVSPSDFWRRWHISLSQWFQKYVYIPLGGSRVGTVRLYLNYIITMGCSGMWHGATVNFLIWGLYYGVLLSIYNALGFGGGWEPSTKKKRMSATALMFSLTFFGWMIFRTPSMTWLQKQLLLPDAWTVESVVSGIILSLLVGLFGSVFFVTNCAMRSFTRPWRLALMNAVLVLLLISFTSINPADFLYAKF